MAKEDEVDGMAPCARLVTAISKTDSAAIFAKPVDPIKHKAPNYYDIIKHPMDLKRIKDKLKNKEYRNPFEVDGDVQLMLDNCLTYNVGVQHWRDIAERFRELWGELWKVHNIKERWKQYEAGMLQEVADSVLYSRGGAAAALQEEQLAAIGAQLLTAASWLGTPLFIQCNGKVGRLLGGHHTRAAALWVCCECPTCAHLPLHLSTQGSRCMTLQELHDHCTTSSPHQGPQLDNQQLLSSFQMTEGAAGGATTGTTLQQFLKSRSEAMGGAILVGRGVWIYWCGTPTGANAAHLGAWQEARIAAYDAATGEHVLQYQLPKGSGRPPWLRTYLGATFHHVGSQPPAHSGDVTPFPAAT